MKTTLSNDELMVLAIYQQPTFVETKEEMLLALPFTEEDPEVFELLQETIHKTESMTEEEYQAVLEARAADKAAAFPGQRCCKTAQTRPPSAPPLPTAYNTAGSAPPPGPSGR